MNGHGQGRRRLTVYTVLVGTKEALHDPLVELPADAATDLDIDYVCFTDNPELRSHVWRCLPIGERHLPPEKLSRRPKALPHLYLPDVEHSLYIDNTIVLRRLPQAADLATARPYLLRALAHPEREQLQQEADAVAQRGYEDVTTICNQLDFYASRAPLESLPPLCAGGVLLRSHHHPVVARFGTLWWENFLAFSKRDQLSMGFALQQAGAEIEPLPGTLNDSDLIRWIDNAGQPRVRANFDAARWSWMHRDDPLAQRDPRAHYLAQWGQRAAPKRAVPLLEYLCAKQHSSLGGRVAPRRQVTTALETLLLPWRGQPCRFLLVQVHDDHSAFAFSDDELAAARSAIAIYLGRHAVGVLMDVRAETLGAYAYQAQEEPYDLAVVLGVPGERHAVALKALKRTMCPQRGAWIAVTTSPVPVAEALRSEQLLANRFGATVGSALYGGRHDGSELPLHNTVIGMRWATPAAPSALPVEQAALAAVRSPAAASA